MKQFAEKDGSSFARRAYLGMSVASQSGMPSFDPNIAQWRVSEEYAKRAKKGLQLLSQSRLQGLNPQQFSVLSELAAGQERIASLLSFTGMLFTCM